MHLPFDVGMLRQQVPDPRERSAVVSWPARNNVSASSRTCVVGHSTASIFFVLGEKQNRKQIASVFPAPPPFINDSIDGGIESCSHPFIATDLGKREFLDQLCERKHQQVEHLHDAGHGFADLVGFRINVCIKKCLCDNPERQPRHLMVHVKRVPILPAGRCAIGVLDHDPSVGRDPLPMKGRLHQKPLSSMQIAFAGQQPLTQQALCALQRTSFDEVRIVCHEDLAD